MQNSESESKTLLSVLEVAERLNVSVNMVRALIESRRLKAFPTS
jgi:excisionase family DNA binding protein